MTCIRALYRYNADKEAYFDKVYADVQESLSRVYEPVPPSSTIIFSVPKPAHDNILRVLYENSADNKDEEEDNSINNSLEDSFHSCMQDPEDQVTRVERGTDHAISIPVVEER